VHPELHELERYVHDALGVSVKSSAVERSRTIAARPQGKVQIRASGVAGTRALFVIDANPEEQSPATVRKHMDMLQTKQHADLIYVRAQVTAYNRKRLIEQKVPFIVPGNQMYLPMLAIDLREHFRRIREESPTFSPSTQVVVLYALLRDAGRVLIPAEMAPLLGYSAMTMTRAFDELETASTLLRQRSAAGSVVCVSTETEKKSGRRLSPSSQPGEQDDCLSAVRTAWKALSVQDSQHWHTTACWHRRLTRPMR
jgi:hypothetical protein